MAGATRHPPVTHRARPSSRPRPRAEDLIDAAEMPADDDNADRSAPSSADDDNAHSDDASGSDSDPDTAMTRSDADASASDANSTPDPAATLKAVSFGALSRAQASLARKRKRDAPPEPGADKLEAVRARLQAIKRARTDETTKPGTAANDSASSDNDEGEGRGPRARSSKHAPAEQSSRYQVSRRREVVAVPRSGVRDPRFGPLPGSTLDQSRTERAYAFLEGYEETEMGELRAAIKRTRNEGEKETLRRKLMSMENRKHTRAEKERRQKIVREHRKKERQAVEEGKTPFYLKKSEQKRLALVDKFEGMKAKDREKAIEKRRKKEGQKEKKSMPAPRRIAG